MRKIISIFIFLGIFLIFSSLSLSAAAYGSGPYGTGAYGIGYTAPTGNVVITGGGGGTSACTYDWVCSEWYPSPCPSDGIQKRVCVNKGTCGDKKNIPSLEQKCTPVVVPPSEPLFDVFVNIFPEYKWIIHQNETKFNIKLINTGNATTIDVSLKYWITYENGRLITEKQETRAIGNGDEFQVTIPIAGLELGVYKTYVQVTYGNNQVAIAEDSFQIVKSNLEIFLREASSFPYFFIPFGVIIIVLLMILLLRRTRIKEERGIKDKKIKVPKKGKIENLKLDTRKYLKAKELSRLYRKRVRQQRRLERRNLKKVRRRRRKIKYFPF